MDVHARESGSPMRSNSVAPTYESRTGDSLRPADAGVRSILKVLALAFATASLGLGCKKSSDCDKAVDHVVHLSYLETQKALAEVPPEVRAETAKMMPTEETMRPKLREVITKRFSTRCQDAAFTKCVLAAADAFAVARCEFPQ